MAHNITNTDHMFSVREVPWHGLGTIVQDVPDSAKALKLARLDWQVFQEPYTYEISGERKTLSGRFVNYRSDTSKMLGFADAGYKIVQNDEAFAFVDRLLEENVRYETAGSLNDGRKVWLLAQMPPQTILGDEIAPYLLFFNEHDGKGNVKVCITPVRVVCKNTLNFALTEASRIWSFNHSGDIMEQTENARHTVQLAWRYMKKLAIHAERLATEKVSSTDIDRIVEQIFSTNGGTITETDIEREIDRFHVCYNADDVMNFRGSKWGLLLAMSDLTSHVPIRDEKHREHHFVETVLTGSGLLDKTFALLEGRAENSPIITGAERSQANEGRRMTSG